MTSNGDRRTKQTNAVTNTNRSRCSSTLLDNDVTNSTCEPTKDLLSNESLGLHVSKKQCARPHKKIGNSINIKRKRCPSPLLDNDVPNAVYEPITEDFVSSRTSVVLDNRNKIKKKHKSEEHCSGTCNALLPERKTPPKSASWGSSFFYRPKNEPEHNSQPSVWESNYYFTPKEKDAPTYKKSLKISKKQVVETRHIASTQRNYRQARPANDSKCNLMRCTDSKISKAKILQVPAKLGHFDDLDEMPALFKGELDE